MNEQTISHPKKLKNISLKLNFIWKLNHQPTYLK